MRFSTLEIHKEEFSFSAGHFTIFSATEREQLHGHNYSLSAAFKFKVIENGLSFDYRHYKTKLNSTCEKVDRHFLLPANSPYLHLSEEGDYVVAIFNGKNLPFLKEDVIILPVTNITIEELAHWFLLQITENKNELEAHQIIGVCVKVYNGPGQCSDATWGEM